MRLAAIICVLMSTCAPAASAQTVLECSKDNGWIAEGALRQAKDLTLKAATAVGDTPDYARWFGTYSDENAEIVRDSLKSVVSAIRSGGVTLHCEQSTDYGCNEGEYAWVYPHRPYEVRLCPRFFDLPPLTALQPGERRSDNGTREGTMVHEISHFLRVANTYDHCYSRRDCREMAIDDPVLAIDNADSYQYYTEDVTYYARQPVSGKPAVPAGD